MRFKLQVRKKFLVHDVDPVVAPVAHVDVADLIGPD